MYRTWPLIATILVLLSSHSSAIPSSIKSTRQAPYPYFPETPQSCQICAPVYSSISSCCASAYLFQNYTNILFDPSGFTDLIACSCTDTFESYFPQCVDCFIQTNQTAVLQSDNLPSLVSGLRTVCAFASTILGGAASADSQAQSSTTQSATSTSSLTTTSSSTIVLPTPNITAASTSDGRGRRSQLPINLGGVLLGYSPMLAFVVVSGVSSSIFGLV